MTPALVARVAHARALGMARRGRVPRTQPPTLVESDYAHRLVSIVDRMRGASRHLTATLSTVLRQDEDPGSGARHMVERFRTEVAHGTDLDAIQELATDFGRRVSQHQAGQIQRQAKAAIGVEIHTADAAVPDMIRGFAHENVTLIKKLQGSALDEIEVLVVRAATGGVRAEVLAEQIGARFDVGERHARLIAHTQITRLTSQVTEARHVELGIKSYLWLHTGVAEKPRPHHVARHGKPFRYDSPPWDGHPGIAIACHCLQQPLFDDIYAELDALGV